MIEKAEELIRDSVARAVGAHSVEDLKILEDIIWHAVGSIARLVRICPVLSGGRAAE